MSRVLFDNFLSKSASKLSSFPVFLSSKSNKPNFARTSKFCGRVLFRFAQSHKSRQFGWLREEIVNMGPLYVKLGQVLSSRTDVIPEEIATVLKGLQSDVPPESFETVKSIFYQDFGQEISEVFETFQEEPFASASIGQVHHATLQYKNDLLDPVEVAVKIQRPEIREDFEKELTILKTIFTHLAFIGGRTVDESIAVLNDMERSINDETNFEVELENMKKFRQVFSETNILIVPRVISSLSSTRILTMEYIASKKVTDYRSEMVATNLMRAFVTAVIERGYLHCDPHPGNIGITSNGNIVLYDYGMVAKLRSDMKFYLRRICMSIFNRNTDALGNLLLESGFVRAVQTHSKSVKDLNPEEYLTMHRISRHMYEYMDTLNVNIFLERIQTDPIIDSDNLPFKLDTELFFLFRSFSILEGVCKEIDPKFNYTTLMTNLFLDIIDLDTILEKGQSDMESAFNPVEEFDEERGAALMRMDRMDRYLRKRRNNERLLAAGAIIYVIMHL